MSSANHDPRTLTLMAIITGAKDHPPFITANSSAVLRISEDALPDDMVQLAISPGYPHVFMSVRCFDSGGLPVTPTGGTFAVLARSACSGQLESPPVASIDATAITTIDWALNTDMVQVTPTGLTGVDHWEIRVITNRS